MGQQCRDEQTGSIDAGCPFACLLFDARGMNFYFSREAVGKRRPPRDNGRSDVME
jgi:hypothetical protein